MSKAIGPGTGRLVDGMSLLALGLGTVVRKNVMVFLRVVFFHEEMKRIRDEE